MNKNKSKENYELSQKQRGEFFSKQGVNTWIKITRENVNVQSMLKRNHELNTLSPAHGFLFC